MVKVILCSIFFIFIVIIAARAEGGNSLYNLPLETGPCRARMTRSIKPIKARKIFDSRGNPTVEVDLVAELGLFHASSLASEVPRLVSAKRWNSATTSIPSRDKAPKPGPRLKSAV